MKRFLFLFLFLTALFVLLSGRAHPQTGDDFGFGDSAGDESFGFDDSSSSGASASPSGVALGGEVSAEFMAFTGDFDSRGSFNDATLGDIFSGALNFSVSGSAADAVINLNLVPTASPLAIDEAYARVYFGPVNVEGGLRKLVWGRADSFGPLDVINPLDYSDLSKISEPRSIKLARPMAHISWGIGHFSSLEGVFVPGFRGHRYAMTEPWAPAQITGMTDSVSSWLGAYVGGLGLSPDQLMDLLKKKDALMASINPQDLYRDSEPGLEYAQVGLRFATALGSTDFGVQYYYGRLPRPAMDIQVASGFIAPDTDTTVKVDQTKLTLGMDYNSYHQIGFDFARVIVGFNTRAEVALNITGDLEGDRADIYNPSVAWSAGFDRDLFDFITVNLQAVETIRLFHDKIGTDPLAIDTEAGKDLTSTRLTLILSKKFFRDKLELKAAGQWDIEEEGFLIMPGIVYASNDVSVELKCGFFGGEKDGELGQYRDNHFVKTTLTYRF